MSDHEQDGGRFRRLRAKAFRQDFLIEAAALALERWDRLSPEEQQSFRRLARQANGDPAKHLTPSERRELDALWRKLEPRSLLSQVLRALRRRRKS